MNINRLLPVPRNQYSGMSGHAMRYCTVINIRSLIHSFCEREGISRKAKDVAGLDFHTSSNGFSFVSQDSNEHPAGSSVNSVFEEIGKFLHGLL